MSFDVPIRKNNGKIEAKIRDAWSQIRKNVVELEMYLGLQEGEETIVSSTDLIALAKFYGNGAKKDYDNPQKENNTENNTENHRRSISSRIDYVF